jgi:hypothetical protein
MEKKKYIKIQERVGVGPHTFGVSTGRVVCLVQIKAIERYHTTL